MERTRAGYPIKKKKNKNENTMEILHKEWVQQLIVIGSIIIISCLLAISAATTYTWSISVLYTKWVDVLIIVAVYFIAMIMFYEYYTYMSKDKSYKKLIMIGVTLVITVVSCQLFSHLISPYCSPLAVLPIILSIMIGGRTGFMGLVVTISTLLLSYSVMDYGMVGELSNTFYEITVSLIVSMIRVLLIMFLIRRNYSRFKLMWGAAAINLVASLPIVLLAMIVSTDLQYLLLSYTYSILGGFIAIIIFTSLIPLYEQIFNIWTNFKLAEICSLARPLLQRLSNEAPGTFNHCIIVSNLAEACAIAVGENPYLAKACGIYHDIGKLSAPEFFTENQQGYNPHDDLIPMHSAKMIMSHTKIGYDMLKKAHLPDEIANVALEHHGTTTVKYFHNKAKLLTEGTVNDKLYMYEGPRPTSKIAAIVMISDVVEAITRSRNTENMDELKSIVENVIKEKIADHQFENSEITFSDLKKIAAAICKVVPGVYHKRIDYNKKK